jgi:hypothetical protein
MHQISNAEFLKRRLRSTLIASSLIRAAPSNIDRRPWVGDNLCGGALNDATVRQEEDSFPLRLLQVLTPVLLASLLYPMPASAADLKPETTYAWQEYLKSAEARSQKHLAQGNPFISIDTDAVEAAKLRRGESLVSPAAPKVPIKIPGGLIHDWTGAIFIPNASVPDILRVTRDYARYSTLYRPTVRTVRPIENGECGKIAFRWW